MLTTQCIVTYFSSHVIVMTQPPLRRTSVTMLWSQVHTVLRTLSISSVISMSGYRTVPMVLVRLSSIVKWFLKLMVMHVMSMLSLVVSSWIRQQSLLVFLVMRWCLRRNSVLLRCGCYRKHASLVSVVLRVLRIVYLRLTLILTKHWQVVFRKWLFQQLRV